MLRREALHPGVVVLPNVALDEQVRLFRLALRAIEISKPPLDMVNTVVEVDRSGTVTVYEMPEP
jgi:hypothetical protein